MVRRILLTVLLAGAAALATWAQAAAAPAAAGGRLALLTLQDQGGDSSATATVGDSVREELARAGFDMLPAEGVRDALRRRRLRSGEQAPPAVLAELAAELGADRLLSVTVHESRRGLVPQLTLSARAYAGDSGELLWAGYASRSGLTSRGLLGIGVVEELEGLARPTVERLLRGLAQPPRAAVARSRAGAPGLAGPVAVLPFASVAAGEATGAADAATQATLAALHRRGVPVVSPNRVAQVLFRHRAFRWGGVDADTRQALAAEVGAASIVTGVVEAWEVAGDELEPEPEVTLALRLVDAASGRIAWTGARERSGWDGEGPFRLGRVYARGALLEGIVDDLMGPLLSGRPTARKGTLR